LNPDFLGRPLAAGAEVLRVEVQETGGEVIGLRVNAQVAAEVGFRNGIPALRALAAMGDCIPPILEWGSGPSSKLPPRESSGVCHAAAG
jgi:hypothetical protein